MLIKKVRTHWSKHFPGLPKYTQTFSELDSVWANQLVGNDLNSLKKIHQAADKSMIE